MNMQGPYQDEAGWRRDERRDAAFHGSREVAESAGEIRGRPGNVVQVSSEMLHLVLQSHNIVG